MRQQKRISFFSLGLPPTHIRVHINTKTRAEKQTQGQQDWSRSGNKYAI